MTFFELAQLLKKKAVVIVSFSIACAVAGAVYMAVTSHDQYTSSVRLYVDAGIGDGRLYSERAYDGGVALSQLLVNDVVALAKDPELQTLVVDSLGLVGEKSFSIFATNAGGSRLVDISITCDDGELAVLAANEAAEQIKGRVIDVLGCDYVQIVGAASDAVLEDSIDPCILIAMAFFAGALVAIVAVVLVDMLKGLDSLSSAGR